MQQLLVTKRPFGGPLAALIRKYVKVVQEIPPHIIVVDGDAADVNLVSRMSDVLTGESVAAFRTQLNFSEQLFLDAWAQTQKKRLEKREHDGLNWGGFGTEGNP